MFAAVAAALLVALLATAGLAGEAAGVAGEPLAGGQAYHSDEYGFSMTFPADWTFADREGVVVQALSPQEGPSDRFLQNVNVITQRVPAGTTAQQYEAAAEPSLRQGVSGYRRVDEGSIAVGGGRGATLSTAAASRPGG